MRRELPPQSCDFITEAPLWAYLQEEAGPALQRMKTAPAAQGWRPPSSQTLGRCLSLMLCVHRAVQTRSRPSVYQSSDSAGNVAAKGASTRAAATLQERQPADEHARQVLCCLCLLHRESHNLSMQYAHGAAAWHRLQDVRGALSR